MPNEITSDHFSFVVPLVYELISFILLCFILAPGKPLNVRAEALSQSKIKITWSLPANVNGVISKYAIAYRINRQGTSPVTVDNISPSYMSETISNLNMFTEYVFMVSIHLEWFCMDKF